MGSESGPILQVPDVWWEVPVFRISQAFRASSDTRSASVGMMSGLPAVEKDG